MLVVYFLPVITHLKFKFSSIRNPQVASLIKKSTISVSQSASFAEPAMDSKRVSESNEKQAPVSTLEVMTRDQEYVIDKDYGSERRRKKEFTCAAVVGAIMCIYSIFVFVLQVQGIFAG